MIPKDPYSVGLAGPIQVIDDTSTSQTITASDGWVIYGLLAVGADVNITAITGSSLQNLGFTPQSASGAGTLTQDSMRNGAFSSVTRGVGGGSLWCYFAQPRTF